MTTQQPTDLQLQLMLAKELSELILIDKFFTGRTTPIANIRFLWHGSLDAITPREWDWVVWHLWYKYANKPNIQTHLNTDYHCWQYDTWQQRAIAYYKTIGKEII